MPLYLVKNNETGAEVAVEAGTKAQAVNHVVNGAYTATVVRDPLESVRLVQNGVPFEKASDDDGAADDEQAKGGDSSDADADADAAKRKAADAAADDAAAKAKAAGV